LKENSKLIIKDLYNFLGVDISFIPDVSFKYNVSGIPKKNFKSRVLSYSLTKSKNFYLLVAQIKALKGSTEMINRTSANQSGLREKLVQYTEALKEKNMEKPEMKPETREYLKDLYREDILKLQDLIGRDLSSWLE